MVIDAEVAHMRVPQHLASHHHELVALAARFVVLVMVLALAASEEHRTLRCTDRRVRSACGEDDSWQFVLSFRECWGGIDHQDAGYVHCAFEPSGRPLVRGKSQRDSV